MTSTCCAARWDRVSSGKDILPVVARCPCVDWIYAAKIIEYRAKLTDFCPSQSGHMDLFILLYVNVITDNNFSAKKAEAFIMEDTGFLSNPDKILKLIQAIATLGG